MLSKRAQNITPAITIELSARISQLNAQGQDIIKLNIGEPDFPPPKNVSAAAIEAVEQNRAKYAPVPGIPELRRAICDKLERDNHISCAPDQICVSAGAKQAIVNAVLAICDPGDEIILPTPCWVSYEEIVKLAGGVPVTVPCRAEAGFALDLEAVRRAVTTRTKGIILCTPNNPTGAVYCEEDLRRLAELALESGLYIISDEIYEKLLYDGAVHCSIASISPEVQRRCITVNGFSKAYAIPGWRLGYSAAPPELAAGIRAIQGHMTSSANTLAQWAGVQALTGPQEALAEMRQEYETRRDFMFQSLQAMPGIRVQKPSGAFYLFPDVSACFGMRRGGFRINNAKDLAGYLLEEGKIAVVFGEAFFRPGHLRLSYANSMDNLRRAMERMAGALAKLEPAP